MQGKERERSCSELLPASSDTALRRNPDPPP